MNIIEAIENRHSVRSYHKRAIDSGALQILEELIRECNAESGLRIQLVKDEPKAFDGRMARYGKFSGVTNYIAMVGRKSNSLDELCGYYGERLVLEAQRLGLNTCWVGLTYKKIPGAFSVDPGEKPVIVIALGYGATAGVPRKSKPIEALSRVKGDTPQWFERGMRAAMLAPTALNQQKFHFSLEGDVVTAKAGRGFYTKVDLGIAKLHFELGAGKENFTWE